MEKPVEAGALGVRRGEASWKWFKSAVRLWPAVLSQAADIAWEARWRAPIVLEDLVHTTPTRTNVRLWPV
jgi:hypothetical protein